MYLSKSIKKLLEKAKKAGCAMMIEGVEFINASGSTLYFDDGTKIKRSSVIAQEFTKLASKKLLSVFEQTGQFGQLAAAEHDFDIGGQSFGEFKRKGIPLIIVPTAGAAQLLGRPTIVALLLAKRGAVYKNMWRIYGWELGNPFRL